MKKPRWKINGKGEGDPRNYYREALHLIDAWSKYVAKVVLLKECTGKGKMTEPEAAELLNKCYGGSTEKLELQVAAAEAQVNSSLLDFARCCRDYEVEKVNLRWFSTELFEAVRYEALREKCLDRLKKEKPIQPLKELV